MNNGCREQIYAWPDNVAKDFGIERCLVRSYRDFSGTISKTQGDVTPICRLCAGERGCVEADSKTMMAHCLLLPVIDFLT